MKDLPGGTPAVPKSPKIARAGSTNGLDMGKDVMARHTPNDLCANSNEAWVGVGEFNGPDLWFRVESELRVDRGG